MFIIIALTIITYTSTDHENAFCTLFTEHNGSHKTEVIDLPTANKLMWELKGKGWETKTTTSYNPFTPRCYTREIRWIHFD